MQTIIFLARNINQLQFPFRLSPTYTSTGHSSRLNGQLPANWHLHACIIYHRAAPADIAQQSLTSSRPDDRWGFSENTLSTPAIFRRRFDARSVYACHVCTRTRVHRIEMWRPFIGGVWPWNRSGATAKQWRGVRGLCTVEERCTVVFHSHYRNVLPCALVAPRNKSSVTVTMDGVQRGNGRSTGGRGLLWRSTPPPFVSALERRGPFVTVVTSFSSLSPVLTWYRSFRYRASVASDLALRFDPKCNSYSRLDATLVSFFFFHFYFSKVEIVISLTWGNFQVRCIVDQFVSFHFVLSPVKFFDVSNSCKEYYK